MKYGDFPAFPEIICMKVEEACKFIYSQYPGAHGIPILNDENNLIQIQPGR